MDTDAGVWKLVELIFGKKLTIPDEMAAHSSIPTSLFKEDFLKKLTNLMDLRQGFLNDRWRGVLDSCIPNISFSYISYVSSVMHYCLYENVCNENIFESFISVCMLLKLISEEALLQTRVDFSVLNPDIFIVFYRKALKNPFRKRKDFYKLVKYIGDHKYHKWLKDFSEERYVENLMKELISYRAFEKVSRDTISTKLITGISLAQEVLSTASVKLPDLPSESEVVEGLVAYSKKEEESEAGKKRKVETTSETSHGEASLKSDSKTDFGKHQENIAWHESIIEAVKRQNHSKESSNNLANNQSNEEATGILEYLENKIKTLIEVLDDCSEE